MKKILLIGQGIAGTLLAWSLRRRGCLVHLMDGNLPGASSIVAAGIINPVTGKRFAKSWRIDELYPVAKASYRRLEQELGVSLWEDRPTLRLLGTPEEVNDWSVRCGQKDYTGQLGEREHAGPWTPYLKPGFHFGVIRQSARVNLPLLIASFREFARREGFFFERTVEYAETDSLLREYDRIVFCEGWRAETNPFFPETPFRVSKGEALIIRFPSISNQGTELPFEMLKKTMLILPMETGTFWVGSTYRWHFEDTFPSADGREYISGYLNEMFAAPFEIVDQVAGIRPTMIDRRPVAMRSKLNQNVFMFNGLGTKGALLAPFFAEQVAGEVLGS